MRYWFSTVTHTISFSGDPEFQKVFAALDELNLSDLRSLFKENHFRVMFIKHLVYRSFLNSWFYDNSLLRGLNTRLYFSLRNKWRWCWSRCQNIDGFNIVPIQRLTSYKITKLITLFSPFIGQNSLLRGYRERIETNSTRCKIYCSKI